jgi:hypothetical protein
MADLPPEARSPIRGPYANCVEVQLSALSTRAAATVSSWLITSAKFHPAWTQWTLYAVHLREVPGVSAPAFQYPGATHEVGLLALNPDTRVTAEDMGRPDWRMRYLLPPNLALQFTATDDEMRHVCALMCWSISAGHHSPEPALSGGPDSDWGRGWLASITKTLAHFRGEVHAP